MGWDCAPNYRAALGGLPAVGQLGVVRAQLSPALSRICGAQGQCGGMLPPCAPQVQKATPQSPPAPLCQCPKSMRGSETKQQTLPPTKIPPKRLRLIQNLLERTKKPENEPKNGDNGDRRVKSKANLFETNGLFLGKDRTWSSSGGGGQPTAPLMLLGMDGRTDGWMEGRRESA